MINVSKEFRETMKQRRDFKEYITMSLADGTVLNLEPKHLSISNNSFTDSAGANTFPLGVALCKGMAFEIINDKDQYSQYDFFGAKIQAYLKLQLWESVEAINKGTYTVVTPETYGSTIQINAADDMYKADQDYHTSLPFPASAQAVLVDACAACQISLGSASFPHDDFVVKEKPKDVTFRQVIGYIAMIAGGNARIDVDNYLRIIPYDDAFFKEKAVLDGGVFDAWSTGSYKTGDSADGGTFNPWTVGDIWDGGEFGDRDNIHILKSFKSLKVDTDDVVITGVKATIKGDTSEDNEIAMSGIEGYVLEIESPIIVGQEREFIDWIGRKLIGMKIRKFSGQLISDPTIEFGDTAYVIDRNGNTYKTFITDCNFALFGFTTISNSIENAIRNKSKYYSEATKAIVESRKIAQQQITEYDLAVQQLTSLITQSFGVFKTEEVQEDGSIIYYMHNKPALAESRTIWKMTAGALAVSTDGGKTWNAGIDASGNAVVNILNAIGINADWIRTGALRISKNGKTTLYADVDAGSVEIVADRFALSSGETIDSIASSKANAALSEAERYADSTMRNFVNAVYNPKISNLQAQIDGQIETWYYDYQPTLSNAPASSWITEAARARHEGDLFYWKSKGYAYRFFKDGSTWKWQMVQDTDVTKALAEAAQAQDTADSKRRVFIVQPTPPYDAGDLWAQGESGDIMRCLVGRQSGNYVAADWVKASKYTDDSALDAFINGDFKATISDIEAQADKKAETWYQAEDPSKSWTTAEQKTEHKGDMWFNSTGTVQKFYRWSGTTWEEMKTTPPPEVFDQIDGKAQIFIVQPKPPYDVGDLWFNSATSDIMTCIAARTSGNYVASDWEKRNKYIDQAAADTAAAEAVDAQTQEDIFNKLTNDGAVQGIYLSEGKIYLNATYIKTGYISSDRIYGGTLILGGGGNARGRMSIRNSNNTEIGRWDNNGIYVNGGSIYCKTDTTGASIYGGRVHLTYGNIDVGYIGTNQFEEYTSMKGLSFDLEPTGAYMTWAAKRYSSDTAYTARLLYANKSFSDYVAGKLYVGCDMDFNGYEIQNSYINKLRVLTLFEIPNDVNCDIYSDVNFHQFEIQNAKISNLVAVNGWQPYTGTLRVISNIINNGDGTITWYRDTIYVDDGIITAVSSGLES